MSQELTIPFRPTVVLDSNIVSYLNQFVTKRQALQPARRRVIERFLRFVISNGLDFNPFFYYLEGALENKQPSHTSYLSSSESMLRLHTMDDQHFLSCGEIRIDPRLLELYRQKYDTDAIPEMAEKFTQSMIAPTDLQIEWIVKLTYAAIMKTALIHKSSRREVLGKYSELRDFMENTFNIALGRERIMAIEYFAGGFDDAIPVQYGASPERALARLRSTARDLLLLHLPEIMLVANVQDGVDVSSIATADRALARIAKASRINAVMAWAPNTRTPLPVLSTDFSPMKPYLGADVVEKIQELDASWQESRILRLTHPETHISVEQLDELIASLEREITNFCNARVAAP